MVDPERQKLFEWVRHRRERRVEDEEQQGRAMAEAFLAQFERKAEEKRKREEWKRIQDEDSQYLRGSIAWEVFKDAQAIMMTHLIPVKIFGIKIGEAVGSDVSCEIIVPNHYPHSTHIELRWKERDHPNADEDNEFKVLCTVARDEGIPTGFRLTYSGGPPFGLSESDEVIPPDDREKLSIRLREAIINAPRAAFDPQVL